MWCERLRVRQKLNDTLDRTCSFNDTSETSSMAVVEKEGLCSTVSRFLPEKMQADQFPILMEEFRKTEQTFVTQAGAFKSEARAGALKKLAEINASIVDFLIPKFKEYNDVMLQFSECIGPDLDKICGSHESKTQDFHKMPAKLTESRVQKLRRNREPALLADVMEETDQTIHRPISAQDTPLVSVDVDLLNKEYLKRRTGSLAIQDNCISLDKAKKPRRQCKPHIIQAKPTAVDEAVIELSNVESDSTFCAPKSTIKNNARKGSKFRAPQANHHALEETIDGHSDMEQDSSHCSRRPARAHKHVSLKKGAKWVMKKQTKTAKSIKLSSAENTSNCELRIMDCSPVLKKLTDEEVFQMTSRPKRSVKKPGRFWL